MKHVKKSSQTILVLNCGFHAAANLNSKKRNFRLSNDEIWIFGSKMVVKSISV